MSRKALFRRVTTRKAATLSGGVTALICAVVIPAIGQQPASAPLVFDRVTIVDVEQGELLPDQRVVIVGNRVQAAGAAGAVKLPQGAQVVDARGQYLIPGLWDLHLHSGFGTRLFYPIALANGMTGFRDPGSTVSLDSLRRWRQEILAGTRVGPPRQILSGPNINGPEEDCNRNEWVKREFGTCIADSADARHLVDSLVAAGADMIKPRGVLPDMWAVIAAEARRLKVPFGGHAHEMTAIQASDSGARLMDHLHAEGFEESCIDPQTASVARCQPIAEHFRRNNTWWVPTLFLGGGKYGPRVMAHWAALDHVEGGLPSRTWLRDSVIPRGGYYDTLSDQHQNLLRIIEQVGLPTVAGTDAGYSGKGSWVDAGFGLQTELAIYVAEGMSPLHALQTATLNPAKMWQATDSLGTVATGKLADLVLLDANPLADITNITMIRAVVANGRYFDRAALDQLLVETRAKFQEPPAP